MDNVSLTTFWHVGTVVFGVVVVIFVKLMRGIVETQWPHLAKQADENDKDVTYSTKFARWYNKVILEFMPAMVGFCLGFVDSPFLFGEDINTATGRHFFGVVVGWFSRDLYKFVRGFINKEAQSQGVDLGVDE